MFTFQKIEKKKSINMIIQTIVHWKGINCCFYCTKQLISTCGLITQLYNILQIHKRTFKKKSPESVKTTKLESLEMNNKTKEQINDIFHESDNSNFHSEPQDSQISENKKNDRFKHEVTPILLVKKLSQQEQKQLDHFYKQKRPKRKYKRNYQKIQGKKKISTVNSGKIRFKTEDPDPLKFQKSKKINKCKRKIENKSSQRISLSQNYHYQKPQILKNSGVRRIFEKHEQKLSKSQLNLINEASNSEIVMQPSIPSDFQRDQQKKTYEFQSISRKRQEYSLEEIHIKKKTDYKKIQIQNEEICQSQRQYLQPQDLWDKNKMTKFVVFLSVHSQDIKKYPKYYMAIFCEYFPLLTIEEVDKKFNQLVYPCNYQRSIGQVVKRMKKLFNISNEEFQKQESLLLSFQQQKNKFEAIKVLQQAQKQSQIESLFKDAQIEEIKFKKVQLSLGKLEKFIKVEKTSLSMLDFSSNRSTSLNAVKEHLAKINIKVKVSSKQLLALNEFHQPSDEKLVELSILNMLSDKKILNRVQRLRSIDSSVSSKIIEKSEPASLQAQNQMLLQSEHFESRVNQPKSLNSLKFKTNNRNERKITEKIDAKDQLFTSQEFDKKIKLNQNRKSLLQNTEQNMETILFKKHQESFEKNLEFSASYQSSNQHNNTSQNSKEYSKITQSHDFSKYWKKEENMKFWLFILIFARHIKQSHERRPQIFQLMEHYISSKNSGACKSKFDYQSKKLKLNFKEKQQELEHKVGKILEEVQINRQIFDRRVELQKKIYRCTQKIQLITTQKDFKKKNRKDILKEISQHQIRVGISSKQTIQRE